jgi:tetratricopeptide (TPR) repeat protein
MSLRKAIAIVLLLVVFPRALLADESATEAKRYYLSGSKHFDLGEYQQALEDFKSAYRVRDDAVLLYNIAQCQRLLGQSDDAVRSYKAYLRRAPSAPNRDEVQAKIVALEQAMNARDRAKSIPPIPPITPPTTPNESRPTDTTNPEVSSQLTATAPPPQKKEPLYKKWWLWTAVGGVVAVGLGVGLGVGLHKSSPPTFPSVGL